MFDKVVDIVAKVNHTDRDAVLGKNGEAKQMLCYCLYVICRMNQDEIAEKLHFADHTPVSRLIKRANEMAEMYRDYRLRLSDVVMLASSMREQDIYAMLLSLNETVNNMVKHKNIQHVELPMLF